MASRLSTASPAPGLQRARSGGAGPSRLANNGRRTSGSNGIPAKRKRPGEDEIQRCLDMIASLPTPLTSALPPSPPPSRSPSPDPKRSKPSHPPRTSHLLPARPTKTHTTHLRPSSASPLSRANTPVQPPTAGAGTAAGGSPLRKEVALSTPPGATTRWSKEKYRAVAAKFRERGRNLKHSGDARMRPSASNPHAHASPALKTLSALELTDALLLYLYAFWADDRASSSTSSAPAAENWRSLSGLLLFTRKRWEDAGEDARPMLGLVFMMEGLVQANINAIEARALHHRAVKLGHVLSGGAGGQAKTPPTATGGTGGGAGGGAGPTPPSASGSSPSPSSTHSSLSPPAHALAADLASSLTSHAAALDRSARYLALARSHLSSPLLRRALPQTWRRCVESEVLFDPEGGAELDVDHPGESGWAWPLLEGGVGGMSGVGAWAVHFVCFARAALEEWARARGAEFGLEERRGRR